MKKLLIMALLIALSACNKKKVAETPTIEPLQTPERAIVVTKTGTNTRLKNLAASFRLETDAVKQKLTTASPEEANRLYDELKEKHSAILAAINELELNVTSDYYSIYNDENGNPKPVADSLREKKQVLKDVGLEFSDVGEGMADISPIPDFYLKIFKNYVTPDYRDFLALQSADDAVLWNADAGIIISWADLGKRIINWENFIMKYPRSRLYALARLNYLQYRYSYLFGMDNTPTHEHESVTLYPEIAEEFKSFVAKYPASDAAKAVMQMLGQNGKGFNELEQKLSLEVAEASKQLYGE